MRPSIEVILRRGRTNAFFMQRDLICARSRVVFRMIATEYGTVRLHIVTVLNIRLQRIGSKCWNFPRTLFSRFRMLNLNN
jgi:hypothetical protein